MLTVGSKVAYPMHGGAVIGSIESHDYDGKAKKYYILKIIHSDMTVSIPVDNATQLGLRCITKKNDLPKIIKVLSSKQDISGIKAVSWNKRLQIYLNQIKTGDILCVAKIYKMLITMDREKKISVGEHRLLHTVKNILLSEIMLSLDYSVAEVEEWLSEICR